MGCHELGFKGRTLPSIEVLAATGKHCVWFKAKPGREKKAPVNEKPVLPPGCSFSFEV